MPASSHSSARAKRLLALGTLGALLPPASFALDANDSGITSIRVIRNRDTAALVKAPQGWITRRDSMPVNPDALRQALDGIFALGRPSRAVTAQEAKSEGSTPRRIEWTDAKGKTHRADLIKTLFVDRFETDPARIRIDTSANGHENVWVVGEDSTVWKKPGASKARLAEGTFGWASTRLLDWKDRAVSPATWWGDLRSLTVDWKDDAGKRWHYKIVRDASRTHLVEPLQGEIAHENAQHVLIPATQLAVDAFVDGPADSAWGFSDPSMTVRIESVQGAHTIVEVGAAAGPLRYVRTTRHPRPVQLLDARFAALRAHPEQILKPVKVDTSDFAKDLPPTPALPHKH